ncbi:hypothetical protein BC940DRAFT_366622, partial [Gongronella butleri]
MAAIPVQKSSSIKTAVRGNQGKPTLVLVAKSIPCRRPWLCSHCPSIQSCRLFAWRSWAGPMQAPTAPNQRAESCGRVVWYGCGYFPSQYLSSHTDSRPRCCAPCRG